MGTRYNIAVGEPPVCTSLRFKTWFLSLIAFREAECPTERGTTYYFSTSGSDSNDGLSSGSPKQSVSAMQTLITNWNNAAGGLRIRLKRGDKWRIVAVDMVAAQALLIDDKQHITIDDYGDGNLANPAITAFGYGDGRSSGVSQWGASADSTYTYLQSRSETREVGWFREEDDIYHPYQRASSKATVESNSYGAWYWASNSLSARASMNGLMRFNQRSYELVYSNTKYGIYITGDTDDVRVENIRVEGFGMDQPSSGSGHWAFILSHQNGGAVLLKGCEGYFCGSHCFGYSQNVSGNGITTLINCRAGWHARHDATAVGLGTAFVSAFGEDREWVQYNCEVVGGNAPDTVGNGGSTATHHDGTPALIIDWGTRIRPGPYQANMGGVGSGNPTFTDLADCRKFVVEMHAPGLPGRRYAHPNAITSIDAGPMCSPNGVIINSTLAYSYPESSASVLGAAYTCGGVTINCRYLLNFTVDRTTSYLGGPNIGFITAGTTFDGLIANAEIWMKADNWAGMGICYNTLVNNTEAHECPGKIINSVIRLEPVAQNKSTLSAAVAFNNDAANLVNNAYIGATVKTGVIGYDADTRGVELDDLAWTMTGQAPAELLSSNPEPIMGYPLEYDFNWLPRQPITARGPFEVVAPHSPPWPMRRLRNRLG